MTAAVVTNQKLELPTQGRLSVAKYVWSTSYAAGGELVIPSQFGVQGVTALICLGTNSDGRHVVPSASGNALQIFNAGAPQPIAQGRVTLVAGTATVTLPSTLPAATKQNIQLHRAVAGAGALGILVVGTRTAGTSFVINSSAGTDVSTVDWSVWPPGTAFTQTGVTGLADRAVLVAGTVTPAQTATCVVGTPQSIFATPSVTGGTPGRISIGTRTAGTSFIINSTNGADTSSVDFLMVPDVAPVSPFVALGRATLVAGTVTVTGQKAVQAVASGQQIFLTAAVTGGTPGNMSVGTRTAGVGFVINSDNAADTSIVEWGILALPGAAQEVPAGTDLSNTFVNLLVLGSY